MYDYLKNLIENYLLDSLRISGFGYDKLVESMKYSLLAGGKRIRPILTLEFARICGGDIEKILPIACAVEMIHTYSLIHDDLPCMDNDNFRRGKPTNHMVFGEYTATLAGDALQPLAFKAILSSDIPDDRKINCALILSDAAGYSGMCGGQFMDIYCESKQLSENQLTDINKLKTGEIMSAACAIGVAAVCADKDQISAAYSFGSDLGLAFQIRDDMLDVISTNEYLGKSVGSDAKENKNTYMSLIGADKCASKISRLTKSAIETLTSNFNDTSFLVSLAESLEKRTK